MRHLSGLDNPSLSLTFLSAEIEAERRHVGLCVCVRVSHLVYRNKIIGKKKKKAARQLFCHAQINTADSSSSWVSEAVHFCGRSYVEI